MKVLLLGRDGQLGRALRPALAPLGTVTALGRAQLDLHDGRAMTAQEVSDWIVKHLRSSRKPEHIEFRADLPYNETGKLLRRVLKQELTKAGVPAG